MLSDDDAFEGLSDDEDVDTSMVVEGREDEVEDTEWSAGDVVGKVLAFVHQVRDNQL